MDLLRSTNIKFPDKIDKNVLTLIKNYIDIKDNEKILFVYFYLDGDFMEPIKFHKNIVVGITDKRIFKIEKGNISMVNIHEIVDISHQKNGIFRWDKVACVMKNGNVKTFGMYHANACKFFIEHLNASYINKFFK